MENQSFGEPNNGKNSTLGSTQQWEAPSY